MHAAQDAPDDVPFIVCELEPVTTTDDRFSSLVSELESLTSVVSGLVLDGTADGAAWAECRTSCDGLVQRARAGLAEAVKISDECSKAGFREWIRGTEPVIAKMRSSLAE